jgi:hypothetical protein
MKKETNELIIKLHTKVIILNGKKIQLCNRQPCSRFKAEQGFAVLHSYSFQLDKIKQFHALNCFILSSATTSQSGEPINYGLHIEVAKISMNFGY